MTVRILAALLLLAMCACSKPPPPPSKLEKSCWVKTIYVPCFIFDEYNRTEWRI